MHTEILFFFLMKASILVVGRSLDGARPGKNSRHKKSNVFRCPRHGKIAKKKKQALEAQAMLRKIWIDTEEKTSFYMRGRYASVYGT